MQRSVCNIVESNVIPDFVGQNEGFLVPRSAPMNICFWSVIEALPCWPLACQRIPEFITIFWPLCFEETLLIFLSTCGFWSGFSWFSWKFLSEAAAEFLSWLFWPVAWQRYLFVYIVDEDTTRGKARNQNILRKSYSFCWTHARHVCGTFE